MRRISKHRVGGSLVVAALMLTVLGQIQPAAAAVRWVCNFGPKGTDSGASFTFTSRDGLGNDSVGFVGKGSCSKRVSVPCPAEIFWAECERIGDNHRATIEASRSETADENTLHFGKCDADAPPDDSFDASWLAADFDAVLLIQGANPISVHIAFGHTDGDLFTSDFPGAGPQDVRTRTTHGTGDGNLQTRIGGNCPPNGDPNAVVLGMSVVV